MQATASCADYIPYSSHISPEIIKVKGGSYLMTFAISGVGYVGVAQEIVDARVLQISKFISQLRAPYRFNCYIHTNLVKSPQNAELAADFKPASFAEKLNNSYWEKSIISKPLIGSNYYLSIIYRPYKRVGALGMVTTRKMIAEFEKQAIEVLGKLKNLVFEYFAEYGVRILKCYENENAVLFSEQLQYLSSICNLEDLPIPVMKAQISDYLPKAHLNFGSNEFISIEHNGKKHFACILSFSEYPSDVITGQLQDFLELPYQMIITQTFQPQDKQEAKSWLEKEFRRLESTDGVSQSELTDLAEAREGVIADNFLLGEYYFSAAIIADNLEDLKKQVSEAQAVLGACGFTASPFKLGKISAWFAQLPANIYHQPRAAKLSSQNISQIIPFETQNRGKKLGNPWGQAICALRTVADEIFYFNFHDTERNEDATNVRALGNTVISGQAGAGKTVLLSFLLAQAQRYKQKPKTIIFDKDLGSSVFVKAMQGKYSQVQNGIPTGFNPFQLENTAGNRAFLLQLMKAILELKGEINISEENAVEEAITQTMLLDAELKTISAFANYLPDGDNSLKQRIKSWVDGEYAWVFNNFADNFSLNDADFIGLDYTQFLDIDAIRTPILMYLFYRVELMLDGRPTIISLDEAWKPLSDAKFAKFIENKSRTIRKQNGILILTSQSPADFFENVPQALIAQIATQIFLPNPLAKTEDYIDKLGLELEEFQIIKGMGIKSHEFLIKQQGESTHCKLNLKDVAEVDVLSGSQDRAIHADKLIAEYGENWLEHYYQTVGNLGKTTSN